MSHRGVQYVKQDQPSFLKKFKEKVGMKPEATVADKLQEAPDDCVDEEKEDEKPVVVVLKDGDLTAEEAGALDDKTDEGVEKVVFRKPEKRTQDTGLNATTKKSKVDRKTDRPSDVARKANAERDSKSKDKKKRRQVSSSLLSFDENDDE